MNEFELLYNEYKQIGTDYSDIKKAEVYDQQMKKFRNVSEEVEFIRNQTKLNENQNILDIGIGTGIISLELSKFCNYLYAIDVSKAMLKVAQKKAELLNIKNIEFFNKGFLDYKHNGEKINIVISQLALHHLPDFWKTIALKRIYDLLEPNGILYLEDAIFSFDFNDYEKKLKNWYHNVYNKIDKETAEEVKNHIKLEYSTFDWIIEEILTTINFKFKKYVKSNYFCVYCCIK